MLVKQMLFLQIIKKIYQMSHWNWNLMGKKLYPASSVKYLGIKIEYNLNWKQQVSDIAIYLNMANTNLSKIRRFIDRKSLKSVYGAIFESNLYYSFLVSAQDSNSIERISILQKEFIRIMYFWNDYADTSLLFRESNILKLSDLFWRNEENQFLATIQFLYKNVSKAMWKTFWGSRYIPLSSWCFTLSVIFD